MNEDWRNAVLEPFERLDAVSIKDGETATVKLLSEGRLIQTERGLRVIFICEEGGTRKNLWINIKNPLCQSLKALGNNLINKTISIKREGKGVKTRYEIVK